MGVLSEFGRASIRVRRQKLQDKLHGTTALLFSGGLIGRNYSANPFGFRASSHFLYFVGQSLVDACYLSSPDGDVLFIEPQTEGDVLWHGKKPSLEALSDALEIRVKPLGSLSDYVDDHLATIPAVHEQTRQFQQAVMGRRIEGLIDPRDERLARSIVDLRITHDEYSLTLMKETVSVAAQAHAMVPSFLKPGMRGREVWSMMQAHFTGLGFGVAYNPIITCRGEVLHGGVDNEPMQAGELLLLDVGCEHPEGWASDISRTWPVSGTLSHTQALIHEAVGLAQSASIERCRVGTEYSEVHMAALGSLTQSLADIGILKGSVDALMEHEVGALFFPHGVGHLLGLDVHDMEDLGDIAGYAKDRLRSHTRSLKYLRMNRKLQHHMVVTIEPGFYQIPQLMALARREYSEMIDWAVLERFSDVRGVRLEDDVLIEKSQPVVLSKLVGKPC